MLSRIQNDILRTINDNKSSLLVLLNLSSDFDTVDHNFLLERLKHRGISGTAQCWLKSYLEDRSQNVHLYGSSSASSSLRFGVPQGSVLGPILFTIYTIPLGEICRRHGVQSILMTPNCMYPLRLVMQWISTSNRDVYS